MKNLPFLLTALASLFTNGGLCAENTHTFPAGKPVILFLCAGQSNMGGGGFEPDHGLAAPRQDIWQRVAVPPDMIQPDWSPLGQRVTIGERKVAQQLGPEAAFGMAMAEAFPDHTIALLKVSKGATPIQFWTPGETSPYNSREGYQVLDRLLPEVVAQLDTLVKAGTIPSFRVGGIVWMQGEGNANGVQRTDGEYLAELHKLDAFLRGKLGAPADLPFVLGRISSQLSPAVVRESGDLRVSKAKGGKLPDNLDHLDDGQKRGPLWFHAQLERIRKEQEAFTKDRPRSAWIDIDDLPPRDSYHYEPGGYVEMGRRFGAAMLPLVK